METKEIKKRIETVLNEKEVFQTYEKDNKFVEVSKIKRKDTPYYLTSYSENGIVKHEIETENLEDNFFLFDCIKYSIRQNEKFNSLFPSDLKGIAIVA